MPEARSVKSTNTERCGPITPRLIISGHSLCSGCESDSSRWLSLSALKNSTRVGRTAYSAGRTPSALMTMRRVPDGVVDGDLLELALQARSVPIALPSRATAANREATRRTFAMSARNCIYDLTFARQQIPGKSEDSSRLSVHFAFAQKRLEPVARLTGPSVDSEFR
jgi:hypothetical protein